MRLNIAPAIWFLAMLASLNGVAYAQYPPLFVTTSRTVVNGNPINYSFDPNLTVIVGSDYYGNSYSDLQADVTGGKYREVSVGGNNVLNILNGSYLFIGGGGTSTVNITGGTQTRGYVAAGGSCHLRLGGTANAEFLLAQNNSVVDVDVAGGTLSDGLETYDSATVRVVSGNIGRAVISGGSLIVSGGNIRSIYNNTEQGGNVTILGGNVGRVSMSGNIVNISGGNITDIDAYDNSIFNLQGGTISASTVYQKNDTAKINFFGRGITYSSAASGIDPVSGFSGVFYNVAWTQTTGNVVNTRYFDLNGDINSATPQGATFTVQGSAAPEPGTLALAMLILPAVGLILRRRR